MASGAQYSRILAVKLADLGDLLMITPALQALRAAHPQARLDLLAMPHSARILEGAPYLDNIVEFDKFVPDTVRELLNPRQLPLTLRSLLALRLARYDALAIFHHPTTVLGAWERVILAAAVNARAVSGLESALPHAKIFTRVLTHKVPDRGFGAMHEADYWLAVAAGLGADAEGGWRVRIALSEEHREVAGRLMGLEGGGPWVAVHAGSGGWSAARRWPLERFAGVARRLIDGHDARVVIVGGPDEVEMAGELARRIEGDGDKATAVCNLAGRTTLHETAAVIERCRLFLGNDSGPMHMAAAVGTPVVAVFGPSNKEAWGPYAPPGAVNPHKVVARDLPCQPCFYRELTVGLREGCGPRPCLMGLGVDVVIEACGGRLGSVIRDT
jgi:heptosyltransferase-2